jgi:hypothetical protein
VFTRCIATLADTGAAADRRWRASIDKYQAELNRVLFDDPPRLVLLVPSDDARERRSFPRRPFPRVTDLPAFEPPLRDLPGRIWDARWHLTLLALFLVSSTALVVVCFPASGA